MSTFLGTEQYAIAKFIAAMAVIFLCVVIYWGCRFRFTALDFIGYFFLLGVLTASFGVLIVHPFWPVTPFEYTWVGLFCR
ncbi:MAG: hypothetical protein KF861_19470 [Planctomycetaceae bacterium]|nr:hypothetical protein [Planctomycetaceae bacterium]